MVMKKPLALALTLALCSAEVLAQAACQLQANPADKVLRINGIPGYFFKVHPTGKHLSYIGGDGNLLLNLADGKATRLPGGVDPVWSPDGKFLTWPEDKINVAPASEVLANSTAEYPNTKGKEIPLDGTYQTIGKMDDHYRVISDDSGVSIVDIKLDEAATPTVVNPTTDAPCADEIPTDLPMLSRDGRYLAVYGEGSTRIYEVGKNAKDKCQLALDLGFPTGKVSFNFDNSQIAFHVDQFGEFDSGYFSGIYRDQVKNVVVMNITSDDDGHTLTPTEWAMASTITNPGDGGYYPDFDKDGNIYYLQDINNYFQFVRTSPALLDFRPYNGEADFIFNNSCALNEEASPALNALATLWKEACPKAVNLQQAPVLVSGISPEDCKQLVGSHWTESLQVTREELLASCSSKTSAAPHVIGTWDTKTEANAVEIIKSRCVVCHTKPMEFFHEMEVLVVRGPGKYEEEKVTLERRIPAIDMENLSSTMAEKMLDAIQSGRMPRGSKLDTAESKLAAEYLNRKKMDGVRTRGSANLVIYPPEQLAAEVEKYISQLPEYAVAEREYGRVMMSCTFGREHCDEFLKLHRPRMEIEAQSRGLTPEQQKAYVERKMLDARCQNLWDVVYDECTDRPASSN